MNFIADILLAGGAFGVAVYCFVLSRRLSRFTNLERGVGGAVAVLSAQVDELTRALESARRAADGSGDALRDLTERAEDVSRRLELHVASLHDLEPSGSAPVAPAPEARAPAAEPSGAAPVERPAPEAQAERLFAVRPPAPRAAAEARPEPEATPKPAVAPVPFRSPASHSAPPPRPEERAEERVEETPAAQEPAAASPKVPSYFSRRPAAVSK